MKNTAVLVLTAQHLVSGINNPHPLTALPNTHTHTHTLPPSRLQLVVDVDVEPDSRPQGLVTVRRENSPAKKAASNNSNLKAWPDRATPLHLKAWPDRATPSAPEHGT